MKVNVLITSVSRKIWLVKAFKDALRQAKIDGNIMSVDTNSLSAAFYVSDKHYLVPPSSDPSFISKILRICKKEGIKLIIPTRDGELLIFARNIKRFEKEKICVMVSRPEVIEICNDKHRFYKFLKENNIATPDTMLPGELCFSSFKFPLIIKSRTGSGGKSVFKASSKEELDLFINYVSNPIIQQYIDGKEYTVDLFSDFNGKVITVVPRERIEVVAGESYKGRTVKDFEIIETARLFAEKAGTAGHITLQFIRGKDGRARLIEVNPRFGGGAMLSIKSGADTPLLLVRLITGRTIMPQIGRFKENLIMLRHTKDIFIYKNKVVR